MASSPGAGGEWAGKLVLAPTPCPPRLTGEGTAFGAGLFPERRKTFAHRTMSQPPSRFETAARTVKTTVAMAQNAATAAAENVVAAAEAEEEEAEAASMSVGDPEELIVMVGLVSRKPLAPDLALFRKKRTAAELRQVKQKTAARAREIVARVILEAERKLAKLNEDAVFPSETNRERCATWVRQCLRQRLKLERIEAAYLRELQKKLERNRTLLLSAGLSDDGDDFALVGASSSRAGTPVATPAATPAATPVPTAAAAAPAAAAAAAAAPATQGAATDGDAASAPSTAMSAAEAAKQLDSPAVGALSDDSVAGAWSAGGASATEMEIEIDEGFAPLLSSRGNTRGSMRSARTGSAKSRSLRGGAPQTYEEMRSSLSRQIKRESRARSARGALETARARTRALASSIDPHIRARVLGRIGSTRTIQMREALPYFPDDVAAAEAAAAAAAAAKAEAEAAAAADLELRAPTALSIQRVTTASRMSHRYRAAHSAQSSKRAGGAAGGDAFPSASTLAMDDTFASPTSGIVKPAWRVGRERAQTRMNENPLALHSLHLVLNTAWKMLEVSTVEKVDFIVKAASSERRTEKVADTVMLLLSAARAMALRERVLVMLRSHNDSDSVTSTHLESVLNEFLLSEVDPPVTGRLTASTDAETGKVMLHVAPAEEEEAAAAVAAAAAEAAAAVEEGGAEVNVASSAPAAAGGDAPAGDGVGDGAAEGDADALDAASDSGAARLTVAKHFRAISVKVPRSAELTPFVRVLRVLIQLERHLSVACARLVRENSEVLRFRGVAVKTLLAVSADQWESIENATLVRPEDVVLPAVVLHSRNAILQKRDAKRAGKATLAPSSALMATETK